MRKIKIKKGDTVKVISGANKGQKGKVLRVFYKTNKAIVEGVNIVKRHTKPNSNNPQGGIQEKTSPIDVSNLSLLTTSGDVTRVGYREENNKKVRFTKKTGELI